MTDERSPAGQASTVATFPFRFEPLYRVLAAPFGVMPSTTRVDVDEDGTVRVRFGPWHVTTAVSNVVATDVTGPYTWPKTVGPAHLSFADHGLTFATNRARGLCMRFAEPIAGIEPTGRIRHPGLTVTVADVAALREAIVRA